jgi:hypothetical protein
LIGRTEPDVDAESALTLLKRQRSAQNAPNGGHTLPLPARTDLARKAIKFILHIGAEGHTDVGQR